MNANGLRSDRLGERKRRINGQIDYFGGRTFAPQVITVIQVVLHFQGCNHIQRL